MTPEAKVKKKVYKLLKDNGAYYFSPIMGGYGKAGVPDIIACTDRDWETFFLTLASGVI